MCFFPKKDNSSTLRDNRPLAYRNVIYKAVSKILAMRLGTVLPKLISLVQGAFVTGISMRHNILLCQELVSRYTHCKSLLDAQ